MDAVQRQATIKIRQHAHHILLKDRHLLRDNKQPFRVLLLQPFQFRWAGLKHTFSALVIS